MFNGLLFILGTVKLFLFIKLVVLFGRNDVFFFIYEISGIICKINHFMRRKVFLINWCN